MEEQRQKGSDDDDYEDNDPRSGRDGGGRDGGSSRRKRGRGGKGKKKGDPKSGDDVPQQWGSRDPGPSGEGTSRSQPDIPSPGYARGPRDAPRGSSSGRPQSSQQREQHHPPGARTWGPRDSGRGDEGARPQEHQQHPRAWGPRDSGRGDEGARQQAHQQHPRAWGPRDSGRGDGGARQQAHQQHPRAWGPRDAGRGDGGARQQAHQQHPKAWGPRDSGRGDGSGGSKQEQPHPKAWGPRDSGRGDGGARQQAHQQHPKAWGPRDSGRGDGSGGSKQEQPPQPKAWGPRDSGKGDGSSGSQQEQPPQPKAWGPRDSGKGDGSSGSQQEQPPQPKAWGPPQPSTSTAKPEQEQSLVPYQAPQSSKDDLVHGITSSLSSSTLTGTKVSELGTRAMDLVPARKNKLGVKEGKSMQVEVNFFRLEMKNQNIIAHQYDVSVEPEKPKYMIRAAWNEFVRRNFPGRHPSFDGNKIAVSAGPLTDKEVVTDTFEIINVETQKTKEFKVTLKLASRVNLKNLQTFLKSKNLSLNVPLAELAVIDIVLRNNASNLLVRAGRNFFRQPEGQILSLGDGLEVWYGYYQSAILGWKTYLNFDIALRGFPTTDILKTIEEICLTDFRGQVTRVSKNTSLTSPQIEKLEKHLKGLKVEYILPNNPSSKRVFKINGIRREPACRETFEIEKPDNTKETTNVVSYYAAQKHYIVKYPNLPTLWVGSVKNNIYVPIELCTVVPGQVRNGKLNETQTSNMIKLAEGPAERKFRIKEQLRNAGLVNEFTNEFGISVASEMEKVEARVLNPPKLQSAREIAVRRGQWETEQLLMPKSLKNWCILNLDFERTSRFEREFERDIMDQAKRMGMSVESPISFRPRYDPFRQPHGIKQAFMDLRDKKIDLAFVIIPDKGNVYSEVKKISEIEVGVLTQCIRSSTLSKSYRGKPNRSTFSNILLKVNAKLNGINHALHDISRPSCLKQISMIVGADVTHPSPDAMNMPSIAAVAASHDPKATQYNTIRRLQPPKVEVIQDFQEIMRMQLMYFYRKTGYKPERIIVFRDGVSEGQVDIVLREELMAIRRACISLQKEGYQPPITFLIVQKRHHTRFFPLPGNPFCDTKNPNVPAGTCVDSEVVHPRDLDFYLVSHASRLGTARPTKYKLIYDDSTMTEPELETLTYYLCHLLSRCSKSISYPAPTYYAHLAALRARVHLAGATSSRSGKMEPLDEKKIRVRECFHDAPMFFV